MIKICEVCSEEFEAKRSTARFCCEACKKKAKRIREGSFAKKVCLVCGKEFRAHNNAECCSKKCKEVMEYQMKRQYKSMNNEMNNWE